MNKLGQTQLEDIRSYSNRKARELLLKINIIGSFILLIVFGYMVVNHYQTKLSYLFDSVQESVAQAIVRGDQHILDNMSKSIEQADDIDAVWVTENTHNQIVGFYSQSVKRESLTNPSTQTWMDGYFMRSIIHHKIISNGFGDVGELHLLIHVPALQILFLGTLLLGFFMLISFMVLHTFRRLADQLSKPIIQLSDSITQMKPTDKMNLSAFQYQFSEIKNVAHAFQNLIVKKEESEKLARESLQDATKGRIASVVIHDVKQRLQNAFAAVVSLKRKSNAERELTALSSSLSSIEQIILDIPKVDLSHLPLSAATLSPPATSDDMTTAMSYPIYPIIKSVIREYQTKSDIEGRKIHHSIRQSDLSLRAAIEPIKLQRVISNLLSNSFKSLGNTGSVEVIVTNRSGCINISVTDNGNGCNPEDLKKIGTLGFSNFDAKNSSGTGLASCISATQSWGGALKFNSVEGEYFSATIDLPLIDDDSLFADKIQTADKEKIVIVDDDPEIHKKWRARLKGKPIQSFYSDLDFQNWYSKQHEKSNLAFLFDLRLGGAKDGIDLAAEVNNEAPKWIVTDNWFDRETLSRCQASGLKILSKELIDEVAVI